MSQNKNRIEFILVVAIISFQAGILSFISLFGEDIILAGTARESEPWNHGIMMEGFTITAYCPGACCNGKWEGKTASGVDLNVFHSLGIPVIAVDPSVIPLGSLILYNDSVYLSADTGGLIKGKRIDILMGKHDKTVRFGVKKDQSVVILENLNGGLF